MADFTDLKADFNQGGAHEIYTNGQQAISGARLNYVLNNIVDTINSDKDDKRLVAQYNVTPFSTIKTAKDSGRSVYLRTLDGDMLTLINATMSYASFSAVLPDINDPYDNTKSKAVFVWVEDNDIWHKQEYIIPEDSTPKVLRLLTEPSEEMTTLDDLAVTGLTEEVFQDITEGKYTWIKRGSSLLPIIWIDGEFPTCTIMFGYNAETKGWIDYSDLWYISVWGEDVEVHHYEV